MSCSPRTCAALLACLSACRGAGAASHATTTPKPAAARGVEAAALPYKIIRGHGGTEISEAAFLAELDGAQAICIGEHHPSPHDHWAQLHLFGQLAAHASQAGTSLALGFEMFQRPFQGVLDDYARGTIDEAALRSRSGWADRWGYDFALYRPILVAAVAEHVTLLALNAAKELTKKVAHDGLAKLSPADKAELPELVLDDPEHRAWWANVMEDMGGAASHSATEDHADDAPAAPDPDADARAERIYTAQVVWDESMADGAAKWLAGGAGRQIVILAGSGHCHDSGIVRRLERRGVKPAVSVHPVVDDGEGNVAALVARPENDFVFVMTP